MTYEEAREALKECNKGDKGKRQRQNCYSQGEEEFIRLYYTDISDREMGQLMGRTTKSVMVKRWKLGILRRIEESTKPPRLEPVQQEVRPELEPYVDFRTECKTKGMSYAEMQIAERLKMAAGQSLRSCRRSL